MKKESKNRNTFIMFLLAFLVAFFVVSVIEVLRSSFAPVAPDVQVASAISPIDPRTPGSFADLVDRLKPAVVNISTPRPSAPDRILFPRLSAAKDRPLNGISGGMNSLNGSLATFPARVQEEKPRLRFHHQS
jgi:S1-C subfamily serine protease